MKTGFDDMSVHTHNIQQTERSRAKEDYKKRYERISHSKEFISSYSDGKSDTDKLKIQQ